MEMMEMRKLPIGIQDFADLRTSGYLYADKTEYVWRLVTTGKPYFLGRPRRFGKSLLVSTLKAYFLGKRKLFAGLRIAELEKEWLEYPVFHIDLSGASYANLRDLEMALDNILYYLEKDWGREARDQSLSARFQGLIRRAAEKTGRKVVVLIDEYDRPLVQTLERDLEQDEIRAALKGFYGVLKGADQWLRFVLLTGVTKFSHVSVFSDLNQLEDISMDAAFAGVCGITEAELMATFAPEIAALAQENHITAEAALDEMRRRYNGYRFAPAAEKVYNPFSVINTLKKRTFNYYWFSTGTPSFLMNQVRDMRFDVPELMAEVTIPMRTINDYRAKGDNPIPLLYQTGYLTIKDYDPRLERYTLSLPNEEVKYAFLEELLKSYLPEVPNQQGLYAADFIEDLWKGDIDAFMTRLEALIAAIPYETKGEESEHYFQTAVYLLFKLLGQFAQAEVHSHKGRADSVVVTKDAVYVFEFKITGKAAKGKKGGKKGSPKDRSSRKDQTAAALLQASQQIEAKDYFGPWRASGKRLVSVAAVYNTATRVLEAVKIA